jgi:hypothetical protein
MISIQRVQFLVMILVMFGFEAKYAKAGNDYIVYSPYVIQGQSDIEIFGFNSQDGRNDLNGEIGYNLSVGHAVTNWWKAEVYVGEFNRTPGGTTHSSGYELENIFQISSVGEYWADVGFLASYADNTQPNTPNIAECGPIFEKLTGHVKQRINFILEKQIGGGAGSEYKFRSAYSVSYKILSEKSTYSPGLEAYFRPADNAQQIGPIFYGERRTDKGSELGYSFGIVYGINSGAPMKTLLARLEYEFF